MTNKDYFDLVVYNAYENEDFVRLNLRLCDEENRSQQSKPLSPLIFIYRFHYYLMNSAINLCIYDYYDFKQFILNIKEQYKSFSDFKKYCRKQLRLVYNKITHSYENTWPDEFPPFKYIENDSTISLILKYFTKWEILQINFPEIYDYIFFEKYPLPNDYDIPIQSIAAYVYMLEHNFISYPKTVVYKKYAKFANCINGFFVFDSSEERFSEKGLEYENNKRKETNLKHLGVEWSLQSEEVKGKQRQTCLERYGTENVAQNEEIKNKQLQTCLERYGHKHPAQSEEIKQKMRQTAFEHYGYEHPAQSEEIKEKMRQTNIERYGVETPLLLEEIKEKIRQTNLERYGVEYALQSQDIREKQRLTLLEHYGVENPLLSEEIKEKQLLTFLNRYGVEHPSQSEEIKQKKRQTSFEHYGYEYPAQSEEIKQKMRQTSFEHYGYENPAQSKIIQEKMYQTKRKNNSFNSSKPEDEIFNILFSLYGSHVKRNYKKDKRYNFACDFYIDLFDMFIEFLGFWTHGNHIYNPENESDIQLVNIWKQRLEAGHKSYKNAIDVWTERDPLKRQTAKEKNINYVELWTLKEALEFIDELPILTSI